MVVCLCFVCCWLIGVRGLCFVSCLFVGARCMRLWIVWYLMFDGVCCLLLLVGVGCCVLLVV